MARNPSPPSTSPDLVWFFFRADGRVSRMAYFLGGLLISVFQAFPLYRTAIVPRGGEDWEFWALVSSGALIATLWPYIALGIKRLHDMDKPGIAAISLFIPFVSIIAFVVLCLFPGTPGPNTYGQRPNAPRNG